MDEELTNRFFKKKLQELLENDTKPFPTTIIEQERPEFLELIQRYCLYSPHLKPFKVTLNQIIVSEKLEVFPVLDYGDIYLLVNPN
jgi:hypothetical protein